MTRRKDPFRRIKELSDASVPFDFRTEVLIESGNAPKLEGAIHKKLAPYRVNKSKEFFKCDLDKIKDVINQSNKSNQYNQNYIDEGEKSTIIKK